MLQRSTNRSMSNFNDLLYVFHGKKLLWRSSISTMQSWSIQDEKINVDNWLTYISFLSFIRLECILHQNCTQFSLILSLYFITFSIQNCNEQKCFWNDPNQRSTCIASNLIETTKTDSRCEPLVESSLISNFSMMRNTTTSKRTLKALQLLNGQILSLRF